MPFLDPRALTTLFKAAEEGNPTAKAALSTAGPEAFDKTMTPPPAGPVENVTADAPEAEAIYSPMATSLSKESLAPRAMGQTPGINPAAEESRWDRFKRRGGVEALIGAGLTGLVGAVGGTNAGGGFGAGMAQPILEDIQSKQKEEMDRNHKVWADQWEQAKTLPPEVLNDPRFSELAKAYQGLAADMQKGDVSNAKNASAFWMAMTKYKPEIDALNEQRQNKIIADRAIADMKAKSDATMQIVSGLRQKAQDISDPNGAMSAKAELDRLGAQPFSVTDHEGNVHEFFGSSKDAVDMQTTFAKMGQSAAAQAEDVRHNKAAEGLEGQRIGVAREGLQVDRERNAAIMGRRESDAQQQAAAGTIKQMINQYALKLSQSDPSFQYDNVQTQQKKAWDMAARDPQFVQSLVQGIGGRVERSRKDGKQYVVVAGQARPIDDPMTLVDLYNQLNKKSLEGF